MLRPPAKLRAPSPRLRRILGWAWLVCLGFAIFAQAGGSWRVYVDAQVVEPPFASLGLEISSIRMEGSWVIVPRSDAARAAGVEVDLLLGINGRTLGAGESAEEIARLLQGPDGGQVTLALLVSGDVRLTRSADNRAHVYRETGRTLSIITQFIDVSVAAFIMFVAYLLRRRKFDEPVAILLSFALLFMAAVGTWPIWLWLGLPVVVSLFFPDLIWLALLLIACPAFPSGRYAPRWTRWFTVAVPVVIAIFALLAIVSARSASADETGKPIWVLAVVNSVLVLIGLLCVVLRFRSTPQGAERQQMKWASLGLGAGLFLYAPTKLLEMGMADHLLPDSAHTIILIAAYALNRLSYVVIALGLLAPLLDFRLNDADAAIGRSAGYAAVTTVVGVIWAGSAAAADTLIEKLAANRYPGLAAAISTLIAIAILAPLRTRALAWTEIRFQRALVRLRSLPERIARWQLGDDPGAVADRALRAIDDGVDATCAALVARPDGEPPQVIGLHNVSRETVIERLGDDAPCARNADAFPLRIEMTDYTGRSLMLLIGPRSDGAFYSRQERAAISAIAEPLADAIDAVSRRAALNARLTGALAEISARLSRMPGKAPQRRRKPSAGLAPGR
jgi:hypothetical protein